MGRGVNVKERWRHVASKWRHKLLTTTILFPPYFGFYVLQKTKLDQNTQNRYKRRTQVKIKVYVIKAVYVYINVYFLIEIWKASYV